MCGNRKAVPFRFQLIRPLVFGGTMGLVLSLIAIRVAAMSVMDRLATLVTGLLVAWALSAVLYLPGILFKVGRYRAQHGEKPRF